jgi:hypothetical protein
MTTPTAMKKDIRAKVTPIGPYYLAQSPVIELERTK